MSNKSTQKILTGGIFARSAIAGSVCGIVTFIGILCCRPANEEKLPEIPQVSNKVEIPKGFQGNSADEINSFFINGQKVIDNTCECISKNFKIEKEVCVGEIRNLPETNNCLKNLFAYYDQYDFSPFLECHKNVNTKFGKYLTDNCDKFDETGMPEMEKAFETEYKACIRMLDYTVLQKFAECGQLEKDLREKDLGE